LLYPGSPVIILLRLAVYNYAKASGSEAALAGAVEELGKLFVKKPAASAARPQGQP